MTHQYTQDSTGQVPDNWSTVSGVLVTSSTAVFVSSALKTCNIIWHDAIYNI